MGIIKTNIGTTEVLIETIDTKMPGAFPCMEDTANGGVIGEKILDAFKGAKDIITGIVQEFSEAINNGNISPDETKIGFSMSFTTEGNMWLIKGGSNMTLNIELTWKRCDQNE